MRPLCAACLPDREAERDHLAGLLPGGVPAWPLPVAGCDVLAWARSGLMHLTGPPDAAPCAPDVPVLGRASVIASAIGALSARAGREIRLDLGRVLAGRARLHGWRRRGATSVNGRCRMMSAADGWLAVNLARPDDARAVPAVLGAPVPGDLWEALAEHAASRQASEAAAAAQAVGIPAAELRSAAALPLLLRRPGGPGPAGRLVLDMSAMWAGPLCASIMRQAGWRVLTVEDSRRPDGARLGQPQFHAELRAGIPAVRLDLGTAYGRAELARLAGQAAVVIESSRPRALRSLGLLADDWLAAAPGRVWVSITGYGRADPPQRVAFGDDAAVAGGLIAATAAGRPVFCGDAIADPLTGMLAGAAALAAAADGGGWLLDISMAGVCADLARPSGAPQVAHVVSRDDAGWMVRHDGTSARVLAW